MEITSKGMKMTRIQFGTMRLTSWGSNLTVDAVEALLLKCIENGITTIDTADIYGFYDVEAMLGKVFAKNPGIRLKIQLITKCGISLPCPNKSYVVKHYNSSTQHILDSVDNSLRNMNTSHIDLLLIHRPDPLTHPAEIAEAFQILKNNGKVFHFGVSNYTPSQFESLMAVLPPTIPIVTNQVEFSLFHVEPLFDGTFDNAIKHKITPQIWSPLGAGRLFANNATDQLAVNLRTALEFLAKKYNTSVDIIALSWVLALPTKPTVVLGTTNPERVVASVNAINVNITREEWFYLLQVARGREIA